MYRVYICAFAVIGMPLFQLCAHKNSQYVPRSLKKYLFRVCWQEVSLPANRAVSSDSRWLLLVSHCPLLMTIGHAVLLSGGRTPPQPLQPDCEIKSGVQSDYCQTALTRTQSVRYIYSKLD